MSQQTRMPVKVFPVYPYGEVAVWDNSFEKNERQIVRLAATISRQYRDKDGNWQESRSIPTSELPAFIDALGDAHKYMKAVERGEISIVGA